MQLSNGAAAALAGRHADHAQKGSPTVNRRRGGRSGFGLLEMILTFVLVIGAAAVVFTLYEQASPRSVAVRAASDMAALVGNIEGVFGANHNYSPLDNGTAIQVDAVPRSMMLSGSTSTIISNPWGGTVTLAQGPLSSQWSIDYTDVPTKVCPTLVGGIAGLSTDLSVDGTVVRSNSTNPNGTGGYDVGGTVTACSGTSDHTLSLVGR